ncbi:MAG: 8-amino-7-oxononanoate synthase [Rickettsiales bacterium]|nr:8-amino-7-oxononanoate synthase [Rickettsiales bacterium]
MPPLDASLREQLKMLENQALKRDLAAVEAVDGAYIWVDGKRYINFSSNDYFGLSQDPDVKRAASDALERYGAGAGASRLVTGNHALYGKLEQALAGYKRTEAACVFGSGYLANMGAITSLAAKGDVIFADKLSHACMLDAAQLSGAKLIRFAHNDMEHLAQLLAKHRTDYANALIITETVFSMDGDIAPMEHLRALANAHDSWLLVDDAHGIGLPHINAQLADIQVGTLSKAVGSYGGYVCASRAVIEWLHSRARSLIFSTALPPATLAASLVAIEKIAANNFSERPLKYMSQFSEKYSLNKNQSFIQPFISGGEKKALDASQKLKEQGVWVSAIRPPTVPKGQARLRFTFTALHSEADMNTLFAAMEALPWEK